MAHKCALLNGWPKRLVHVHFWHKVVSHCRSAQLGAAWQMRRQKLVSRGFTVLTLSKTGQMSESLPKVSIEGENRPKRTAFYSSKLDFTKFLLRNLYKEVASETSACQTISLLFFPSSF